MLCLQTVHLFPTTRFPPSTRVQVPIVRSAEAAAVRIHVVADEI